MASFRQLLETAVAAYVSDLDLQANVYTGFDTDEKELPCIVCSAKSCEEEPLNSGNFKVTLSIETKAKAGADSTFDTLSEAVKNAVHAFDFPAALCGESLTVWGQSAPIQIAWDNQDDAWVETLTVEVYAAPIGFSS